MTESQEPVTAADIIAQYQAGRRDYRGASLVGAKQNKANLEGANLSGANLHEAELSNWWQQLLNPFPKCPCGLPDIVILLTWAPSAYDWFLRTPTVAEGARLDFRMGI